MHPPLAASISAVSVSFGLSGHRPAGDAVAVQERARVRRYAGRICGDLCHDSVGDPVGQRCVEPLNTGVCVEGGLLEQEPTTLS